MDIALVTQADVMNAFRNRLLEKLPGDFNETNVYFDDEPFPTVEPEWDFACSISMQSGQFDTRIQQGGSPCLIQDSGMMDICVMQHYGEEDPAKMDVDLIGIPRKSVLGYYKPRIMSTFLVDYRNGGKFPWDPMKTPNSPMLAENIKVVNWQAGRHSAWPLVYLTVSFSTVWNWKL